MNWIRIPALILLIAPASALAVQAGRESMRYVTAQAKTQALEEHAAAYQQSVLVRNKALEDLITGRLSLDEAADAFCASGAGNSPDLFEVLLNSCPGASRHERACQ